MSSKGIPGRLFRRIPAQNHSRKDCDMFHNMKSPNFLLNPKRIHEDIIGGEPEDENASSTWEGKYLKRVLGKISRRILAKLIKLILSKTFLP